MIRQQPVREVVDLTEPARNVLLNMSEADARARVLSGVPEKVERIDGQFAFLTQHEHLIRMARSLGVPLRYFIAKRADGPALVAAHRIDMIRNWLKEQGLADQFHPSYTRMVPAHYITEVALVGCPDPSPTYKRFFTPKREALLADPDEIGRAYMSVLSDEVNRWLDKVPPNAPIGVSFSGGIDSGSVFLLTYHALISRAQSPARLKAFTLSVDGGGADVEQARRFLEALDLQMFHEPIEVASEDIDYRQAVRVTEDYKPLDIQAGAMNYALCRAIRQRYPDWTYLIDGDGGDENLKDYPIEENPELTIRSVLNNPLLYHEGWGVDAIKHSLTYTGGLSRGCTRTFAPVAAFGFTGFSPYMLPSVIRVAEGIPFIELTDWRHDRLYALKGEVVSRGVRAVTGLDMPVFQKRRFQRGAAEAGVFAERFPESPWVYRREFDDAFAS